MHDAHAGEVGTLHARYGPEDALLLAPLQARLEAHHVEESPLGVILPELHHRVGLLAGPRVRQPDRLHRAEAQGLVAAAGYGLHGEASLEVHILLKVLYRGELRGGEGFDEGVVLLPTHRAVQVRRLALAVAGGEVDGLLVERVAEEDRGRGVVEVERLAGERLYLLHQGVRGQGAGGDDGGSLRQLRRLLANHLYVRVVVDRLCDGPWKIFAGDPQRAARRDAVRVGAAQDHGPQPSQLLLE